MIGDATATITTNAGTHGITAAQKPIDTFAGAVSCLSDAEVSFDSVERLLLALTRAGMSLTRSASLSMPAHPRN